MIAFKKLEDLIFMEDKSPMKTAKITSLKNLYMRGITVYQQLNYAVEKNLLQ